LTALKGAAELQREDREGAVLLEQYIQREEEIEYVQFFCLFFLLLSNL
jgi:hypothetical protein